MTIQIGPPKRNIGSQIGQSLGMGLQSGIGQRFQQQQQERMLQQKMLLDNALASQQAGVLKNKMLELGVPEHVADLYSTATEGGKTAILQNLIDLENRGLLGKGLFGQQEPDQLPESDKEFTFPNLKSEKGLKPSETVTRESGREKTNIPLYNESREKLRNLKQEGMSLNRIEQLNKSGKLPSGLGRFNVNIKSGELILPFLSSPETQLFIKTINDFTTKAKDSYGARVTNFELDRFMKRLPTLLNSPEGRELVIEQMKLINDLNELDQDALIKTYDHYGVGKLNAQQAASIADKYKKEKEKELLNRYKNLDGRLKEIQPQENASKEQKRMSLEEIFG